MFPFSNVLDISSKLSTPNESETFVVYPKGVKSEAGFCQCLCSQAHDIFKDLNATTKFAF